MSRVNYIDKHTILHSSLPLTTKTHLLRSSERNAAESAFTGAYQASQVSDSIAEFAEKLDAYKRSIQIQYIPMPTTDIDFSSSKPLIITLLIQAIGADDIPAIDPKYRPHGYATVIPSGEGNSTLQRLHPDLFIDQDHYTDFDYILPLIQAGKDWEGVARYLRSLYYPRDGRILLTRHWNNIPPGWIPVTPTTLVPDSLATGLRLNTNNRWAVKHNMFEVLNEDFATRNARLVAFAKDAKRDFQKALEVREHTDLRNTHLLKRGKKPTHSHGALNYITVQAGFSLYQNFLDYILELQPTAPLLGKLGKIYTALLNIPSDKRTARTDHLIHMLAHAPILSGEEANFLAGYLDGSITLIPPALPPTATEIVTVVRDVTLMLFEEKYMTTLKFTEYYEPLVFVSRLEQYVYDIFTQHVLPTYTTNPMILT
jgi:hypothetical protein